MLRQRSRAIWIKERDQNIKFFHAQLKASQTRNRTGSIYNDQGVRITEPKMIEQEFTSFFQSLLGECAKEQLCIDLETTRNGPYLTKDQQKELIRPITEQDIEHAVKELPNDKAPGVDGVPAEFFKVYLKLVGSEVKQAVKDFFDNGKLLRSINLQYYEEKL